MTIDVSEEFQLRRAATWRGTRFGWGLVAITGIAFWLLTRGHKELDGSPRSLAALADFVIMFASAIVVIRRTGKLYLCPNCGKMPMASDFRVGPGSVGFHRGVAINPTRCSECGALLRRVANEE